MFLIGLGLKVLFEVLFLLFYPLDYCCLLLVILPKDCGPFFLMLSLAFVKAHYELVMNQERQNRTVYYLYNADTDKAS
jgi:hypothetical protein